MRTIITLIALLFCGGAQARIGETPTQCITRYGEPLKSDKETMTLGFQKEGIFIMCVFHDGTCEEVAFKKADAYFSAVEVETLLNANGPEWKDGLAGWSNASCVAIHKEAEGMLVIMTREAKQRRDDAKAAAEKAKLKGF